MLPPERPSACWVSQGSEPDGGHCNQTRGLQSKDEFCKARSVTRGQTTMSLEFSSTSNWRWQARRATPHASISKPAATLALKQPTINLACNNLAKKHWFHSLPFQRFQALLTLFPKSFSSFLHSTCLLSVSGRYLALEENYLPFSAPLPKYATLWKRTVRMRLPTRRDSHPLWCFLPKRLALAPTLVTLLKTTIQCKHGFTVWALPGSFAITKGIIFIFFSSTYLYA